MSPKTKQTIKQVFLIACAICFIYFGVLNCINLHWIKGILKIGIGGVMLIIYSDKNLIN